MILPLRYKLSPHLNIQHDVTLQSTRAQFFDPHIFIQSWNELWCSERNKLIPQVGSAMVLNGGLWTVPSVMMYWWLIMSDYNNSEFMPSMINIHCQPFNNNIVTFWISFHFVFDSGILFIVWKSFWQFCCKYTCWKISNNFVEQQIVLIVIL